MENRQALIDEIEAEFELTRRLSTLSFRHFVQTFWCVIEPATPFVPGWHIDAICDHLEATADFAIKRLLINMPPRHMKSILVSVMFPAWIWAKVASRRFVSASYSHSLALRDATKSRDLLISPHYQQLIKPKWQLKDDQNQKTRYENTATGFRFATGVGGTMTGEGGDYILVDDPINPKLAASEVTRESCLEWWKGTMSTRVNDPKKSAKIIVMQRLHEKDLSGYVLEAIDDGLEYDRLILPAEFRPKSKIISKTRLEFVDPRKEENELLWPERFDRSTIDSLKKDLGSAGSMGQLQQDPQPSEGGLFKENWWKRFSATPPFSEIIQFWDCAQKPGITNDYSVCSTWAVGQSGYAILDVWRGKVETPKLEAMANALADQWKPSAIVIEDKSAGSALIQYLLRSTTLPVIPYNPKFDKETRATAATPTVEAGKVSIPENAPWTQVFIDEHKVFPNGAHDDIVDTTSMAVDYLRKRENNAPRIRTL